MRNTIKALLTVSALLLAAPQANAGLYYGAKTGPAIVDASGVDDPTNGSLYVGYELGVVLGDIGVEAEISRTIDEGTFGTGDVEVETEAVYATFRSAGPIYFKAKTGIISGDILIGGTSFDDDFDTSTGIGIGLGLGILQIELEYTKMHDDVDFISVGIQF